MLRIYGLLMRFFRVNFEIKWVLFAAAGLLWVSMGLLIRPYRVYGSFF